MKTGELAEANAPLSQYAREATKQTLVVTRKGKPIFALMRLPPDTDLENLSVTTHPTFQGMRRADARYQAEGGLSTDQVRRRLVARRAARRKR